MIFLSNLIKEALYFSGQSHDGQYRKGGHVPYLVHPVLVAALASEYTKDEEIIAAALLHDVMEDCSVKENTLKEKFGDGVAALVREVSYLEEDKINNEVSWRERKGSYLKKIETISEKALFIVAADKMTNMKAYFEALKVNPEKVNTLFKASAEDYRWYYVEIEKLLNKRLGDCLIVKDYNLLISAYK